MTVWSVIAGEEGSPTIWLYVSGDHYQLVVPQQEMVSMRPPPDASPSQFTTKAESYFMLPCGGFPCGVDQIGCGSVVCRQEGGVGDWLVDLPSKKCLQGPGWNAVGLPGLGALSWAAL